VLGSIAFSLAIAGIVGIISSGLTVVLASWDDPGGGQYVLTAVPMFILMALLGLRARPRHHGRGQRPCPSQRARHRHCVRVRDLRGHVGASLAAAAVMSGIAMPEMRRRGYSDELAAGSIGIGATLDILIPPSVGMVIYGISTQTSIGKLLIAGVIPGIIVAIFLRHHGRVTSARPTPPDLHVSLPNAGPVSTYLVKLC
jgi:hypothetical protein